MLRTLPPTSYSRAAEILSRYRPIAPKPDTLPSGSPAGDPSLPDWKIHQTAYQRTLCPQLQARPTRTRKRGRAPSATLPSSKRHHYTSPAAHACAPPCLYLCGGATSVRSLATLPLLPGSGVSPPPLPRLDYLTEDFVVAALVVPEEKDLLRQLQVPCAESHHNDADTTTTTTNNNNDNSSASVISPRPVRPVGSSIIVGQISEYPTIENPPPLPRRASEVEEELESEALPAIISDSKGRVRLANSAYEEMVGQPECPWLDSVVIGGKSRRTRISGDVILRFCEEAGMEGVTEKVAVAVGFQCWARIEWGEDRKRWVKAGCDVRRLWCESKDYVLYWRFHAAADC